MFENKHECCPFGHQLWPGKAQVSWKPCPCEPAREAAGRGRGMGHVLVACNSCHDDLRQTVFFEPPHHSGHQPLAGWVTGPGPQPWPRQPEEQQPLTRRCKSCGNCHSGIWQLSVGM